MNTGLSLKPASNQYDSRNSQSAVCEQRQPMVTESLNALDKTICYAAEQIHALRVRLNPVLRLESATDSKQESMPPQPIPNTVYDRINSSTRDVSSLANGISEILRLLEV
jgi:hypothetical protein